MQEACNGRSNLQRGKSTFRMKMCSWKEKREKESERVEEGVNERERAHYKVEQERVESF